MFDWNSKISFGKHRGCSLLNLLITEKQYLTWAYDVELHLKYEELFWLFDNLSIAEKRELNI